MFEEFMGTKEVSERQQFDLSNLASYLRAKFGIDLGDRPALLQFKGGQSNPSFKLSSTDGRQHYVLRSKPAPQARLLPSAHAIEREFRVMQALHGNGFPVPRQYGLCLDETVIGRAFYLMQFVDGRILWDQSLPSMTAAERAAIYDEMNRVITLLHGIDYGALGLGDFGKPGNYFARQIERWSRQYKTSETEPIAAMEQLMAWLPQHIPAGEQTCIVHGDYRMDNLIFHASEPRIVAVLDWELATLGHPLADFSYHCMSWHIAPGQFRGIAGLDHAALGIPSAQQYIDRYCARTGHTIGAADFEFYLAYNMFRLAAILQGIMKRHVDGTAASEQAKSAGQAARPLAELAWRHAQRAGSS
jgi:aminoglycoside phosphotransferase (APT) family kinase protein